MWLMWPLKCHNCSQETLNFLHDGMFVLLSGSLCGSGGGNPPMSLISDHVALEMAHFTGH